MPKQYKSKSILRILICLLRVFQINIGNNLTKKAYLQLHIAIFLWGFTAILGDLISLSAFWLVLWRVAITSATLILLPGVRKSILQLTRKLFGVYFMVGALIAIHWVTFFGAIKYANASVGLVAMATVSLFTAFIEPLYFKRKIRTAEVLFGLLVIPAMLLIVKDLQSDMRLGLGIGLISAFLAAMFAVINKKYVEETDPQAITFVELFSAFLVLAVMSPIVYTNYDSIWWPVGLDWIYLLILAVLCTCVAFILHLYALKHISAFASNLAINLEPVYGIILAGFLLGDFEELNYSFYLGVVIILLCVIIYPRFSRKYE